MYERHSAAIRDLDWVSALDEWTLDKAFEALRAVVERDIRLRREQDTENYEIIQHPGGGGSFTVSKGNKPWLRGVYFLKHDDTVEARTAGEPENQKQLLTAKPEVSDGGEKMFKVDGDFLYPWQISRKALERLFFGRTSE